MGTKKQSKVSKARLDYYIEMTRIAHEAWKRLVGEK